MAVLQSRTSAVGAGDLWKSREGEGMPLKCSEFWRGWGNRREQQLHVICRIMRLVDKSRIMRLEGECGHSLILLQSVDSCGAFLPLGSTRERLL